MVHTIHISITPTSTSDFSSAIDRAPGARSKSDEKSEVLVGVIEIMLTVNYSHSGEVLRLLGTSPNVLSDLGRLQARALLHELVCDLRYGCDP